MARTNIELDDRLVREGMKRTGLKTKRELVNAALESFVRKKRLKEYFESMAGVLKTKGQLGRGLIKERKKDRTREEKK